MNLDRLINELALDEGLRLLPYEDTTGHLTIGYGCNLDAGISERVARFMLLDELVPCVEALEKYPFWHFANDARRNAFINMAYNLGVEGFAQFRTMIAAANRGDWNAAADAAVDSRWYVQVKTRGPRIVKAIRVGKHREQ